MLLKRFYDVKLAQASYLIGCQATGEALVVDANRDVEQYMRSAVAEGVRIAHVTETHIHADFVTGSRELAHRTGAALYLSGEGGVDWSYAYAPEAGATLLRDGDTFRAGHVVVRAMHTPGHTPEHICFLVTDSAGADRPMGILSGDFVFVGDVGRPDLLERAAKQAGTMQTAARTLFKSLEKFRALPDYLQLWPGHGAGSACGKGLGAVPQSTVGYEKMFNWALAVGSEDEFVPMVLAGQPEPPPYFAHMKRINKEGPTLLGELPRPRRLAAEQLATLLGARESASPPVALVIDIRPAAESARGAVPGTFSIPHNKSFTSWAGWLLPYDRDLYLIVGDAGDDAIDEAVRDLAMIGLDRVAGYFGADSIRAWASAGRPLDIVREIAVSELASMLERGAVTELDVRAADEWESGHLPGVANIPLGYLTERLDEVPRGSPLVTQCQG
ncbi:MAG: rhodanese-like domain-containing protein, partial [Gemmatimonadota bacterium]|nr:rhodanese-like domain-containing protein [Gemmatimonadota bacterium]